MISPHFSDASLTDSSGGGNADSHDAATDTGRAPGSPSDSLRPPFAGENNSGSSAPGQQRPRASHGCAADTIDTAVDATEAEQSTQPGDAGCVAPGDPAQALDAPMNQHRVPTHRRLTTVQLEQANEVRLVLAAALPLLEEGFSQSKVADMVGVSEPWLCRQLKRVAHFQGKKFTAAERCRRVLDMPMEALARKSPPGRKPKFALTETEAGIVAAHNLQSNRTATAGSPQEALKHAIKNGEIGKQKAEMLLQRERDGKPLLTEAMRRQVEVGETTVRAYRTPRNAWLNYVQSPGSLQITVDPNSGEERMVQPGEWMTIDDATINLVLTVPIGRPGDKCWEKFGVMCGRFQFIVPADHRSYFIPGFSFTARPRSSYRAEDMTATMHTVFREHGMPQGMFLEMGISKSKLVHETLRRAGIKVRHVHSEGHRGAVQQTVDEAVVFAGTSRTEYGG